MKHRYKYFKYGIFYFEYSSQNFGLGANLDLWKEPALSFDINLSVLGSIQLYIGKNKNGNEY